MRFFFFRRRIYTFVGSVLCAINPFEYLPIYAVEDMARYDQAAGAMEPHVYEIARIAYSQMMPVFLSSRLLIIYLI